MNNKILHTTIAIVITAVASGLIFGQAHDHSDEKKSPVTKVHDDHDEHDEHDEHDDHDNHTDEVKLPEAALKQFNIRIDKAQKRSLTASLVAPARIGFNTEAMAHVGSVVQGRVVDIKVRTGDRVSKSDVLLVVESPELGRSQSGFLQRRTEADVAAAAVAPSKESYDRAKKLFDESQGIAFTEVQKRDADYRAAAGAKATSAAAAQAAENELKLLGFNEAQIKTLTETGEINPRFEIRSSIDGHVIEREITLGELVSPDKEKLLVIADTSNYWVWADVPEARLGDIGVGSKADLSVAALPGQQMTGEVSFVSAEVDPSTRSARVRIVLENGNAKLKPGMFARVTLFAAEGEAVLAIPESAVQLIEGATSVFVPVEGEPNTFTRRQVSVSKPVSGYVLVLSGLKEGEHLVTSGSFILKAELGKSEAGHDH